MNESIILFGAGAAGRYALRHLREMGVEVVVFVDSNPSKWGTVIEGVTVFSPEHAASMEIDASWVAAAISRPAATEIRERIKTLGVRTKPLWECVPVCHGNPTSKIQQELISLVADAESVRELESLYGFRYHPNYETQRDPSPISELYFPNFITHRDDEHFVDCGACDGDTVKAFIERWNKWERIDAIEPDPTNFKSLRDAHPDVWSWTCAIGDRCGETRFVANGDYSSRVPHRHDERQDGEITSDFNTLDLMFSFPCMGTSPTFIKMDIEGYELEALWGARKLLKEHSPVLAICAYHTSDHLWEIPLLIHAINPEYSMHLRRYAEGAFELVWYAVPKDRLK